MDTAKNRAIGACLRAVRTRSGLTQVELAARLAQPQSFVSKLESGERSLHVAEFFSYATALGTEPGVLLDEIGQSLAKKDQAKAEKSSPADRS